MKTILSFLMLGASAFGQQPPAPAPPPTQTELEQVKTENAALRKYIADYEAWVLKVYNAESAAKASCLGQAPAKPAAPAPPAPAVETKP
jgi:hypothetical protein